MKHFVITIRQDPNKVTKLELAYDEAERLHDVLESLLAASDLLPESEEFQIVGELVP